MILKNVFDGQGRVIRAVVIDSRPAWPDKKLSYGTFIDALIINFLAPFSARKKVYKIEDEGALVGFYIIDYTPAGNPILVAQKVMSRYKAKEAEISQQIIAWSNDETKIKALV